MTAELTAEFARQKQALRAELRAEFAAAAHAPAAQRSPVTSRRASGGGKPLVGSSSAITPAPATPSSQLLTTPRTQARTGGLGGGGGGAGRVRARRSADLRGP